MRRRFRKTLGAMSLLLLLATLTLWLRSYWVQDRSWLITYAPQSKGHYRHEYGVEVRRGRVTLAYQRCVPWDYMSKPSFFWNDEPADFGGNGSFEFHGGRTILGFGYLSFDVERGGTHGPNEEKDRERDLLFPLWFLALCLAVPATSWLRGAWKRTRGVRRARLGLCANCGYDLRASQQRCPECGLAIPQDINVAQSAWGRELLPIGAAALLLTAISAAVIIAGRAWLQAQHAAWTEHIRVRDATEKAMAAASAGDEEEFDRQMKAGAMLDPKLAGDAMWSAISSLRPGIAKRLVEAGADVNFNDGIPMTYAASEGYFPLVVRMVEKGANPNVRHPGAGQTAIYFFAERMQRPDDLKWAAALLDKGADPNIADDEGTTPLHLLIAQGPQPDRWDRVDFARLLITHGADINTRNKQGTTPLGIARATGQKALAALLVSKGAKP
jgi:hypothetical protein